MDSAGRETAPATARRDRSRALTHPGSPRRRRLLDSVRVLAVIAAGGLIGSAARYAISVAAPTDPGQVAWSTLITNVSGCLLIGVLMVLILEARQTHPLVRSFIGVGVLGGYTTFSTYTVDAQVMIDAGHPGAALAYLLGTIVAALGAVQVGVVLTRAVALPRPDGRGRRAKSTGDNS